MAKSKKVRKTLPLSQEKIDRAKRILGTRTESETVEMALDQVCRRPRAGWEQAFRAMAAAGDDKLILPKSLSNEWDSTEWEWDPPGN